MNRKAFLACARAALALAGRRRRARRGRAVRTRDRLAQGPRARRRAVRARVDARHRRARRRRQARQADGQPFVIDNKPGAAGNLGTDAIAKAAPDGQTIGVSIAGPLGVNALLYKKMPYDPAKDLELVSIAATQPSVLVVPSTLGVNSTDELVALMKKNPGKYNYSSMGAGTHLAPGDGSARRRAAARRCVHVPYAGSGPPSPRSSPANADIAALPAAAVMPHVKAGKLKALAVATEKRSAALPELPTLARPA